MPSQLTHEAEPFLCAHEGILRDNTFHRDEETPTFTYFPGTATQRYQRLRTIMRVFIQLSLCSLLIVNFVALVLFFKSAGTTRKTIQSQLIAPNNDYVDMKTGPEPKSAAALFDLQMKTLHTHYGSDVSYMTLDPAHDWLWSLDGNEHAGLIQLDPPNRDGSIQWGAVTMFHQLHCLTSIRTALQRASHGEKIGLDYHDDAHWPHCFNYLRQSILCQADDVIELPFSWGVTTSAANAVNSSDGATATSVKRVGSIDGSRDMRVCRDTDELYRLLAERGYHGETLEDET